MIRGLNTSGGVQRSDTGFVGAAAGRGLGVGRFRGFGADAAAFFGAGGWPWGHCDLGRSHSSQ